MGQITFISGGATRMTTTKRYDFLNRLTSIGSVNGQSAVFDSHSYTYNSANQRTGMTNSDSSYWGYQYDYLGQVTNAVKYWPDATRVAGQQFGYAFDSIGNRQSTAAGGDQTGANLRSTSYTANNLNQYSSRSMPSAVDVIGSATNAATVTVNGQPTYRKNDYYWLALGVANSSGPVYQSVTNTALLSQGSYEVSSNSTGNIFVPQSSESFTYDADGNLSTDGRWTFTWDAENRLITLVARTAAGPQQSIRFEYDTKGRRIGKKVWNNITFNGTPAAELKFLYDGWNLIATLTSTFALQATFIWGLDLSGSVQGAGGIGGLLSISDTANGAHFICSDGNGSVTALIKVTDSTFSANCEYGPFGEAIRTTGPMAKANPFRFSSKYQDDETDLIYYGYRYYGGSAGRWTSRDPLGDLAFKIAQAKDMVSATEKTEPGLYLFCRNRPTEKIDLLGLECENPCAGMRPNANYLGTVVCCGGNRYVCVFGPPFPGIKNAKAASIIAECLRVHEALHIPFLKPCKKCAHEIDQYKSGAHDTSECVSLTGELSCLETSLDECNGDEDCRLEVMGWANGVYRQAAGMRGPGSGYCKNPPPPPPWWPKEERSP